MNKLLTILLLNKLSKSSGSGSGFPPDWSQIGYSDTPEDIINAFNHAKNIYDNWNDSTTSLYGTYENDTNLIYMPLINTQNVTSMDSTFSNCSALKYIPVLDTKKAVSMTSIFSGCSNLTNESLNNIMAMCINTTSAYTGLKTLNWLGINSTQATICEGLSNYQAFLDAGWSKS